ncbi:hypothetical protein [Cellulomonas sp. KRMCY2]|uniref:hypothetical protein n=1 Tax=Cellulomonas sp. KRMCY2 TaxID=1304865 RepID=UPI00045EA777|nr:hypothetical protein [Cellulomonas sp. KRMCY2]
MSTTKTAPWVAGTAFLAIVLIAASWLFAISPRMESAGEMRASTAAEQVRSDQLEIQLAALERDFANIEDFRTELAGLRAQIPTGVEAAQLSRQLVTLASASGVVITSVMPSSPTAVIAAAPAAPEPTGATEDSIADGASDAALGDSAVPTAPTATGFFVVEVAVTTIGGYEESLAFLETLQTGNPRLVFVSAVQANAQKEAGAQSGRPAVADGALELRLTISVIVLPDTSDVPEEPEDAPAEMPVPSGQGNPFAPLTVSGG